MRKILASDYDGTLRQGEISLEAVEAIKKWQAEGNLFGIVTGRDHIWSYEMFKRENRFPFDFVISHGGAVACDSEGNILYANSMKGDTLAMDVVKAGLELSGNPCGIAFEKTRLDFKPEDYAGPLQKEKVYSPLHVLEKVKEFHLLDVHCANEEQATEVTCILKERFGTWINPSQNGNNIDVSPAGVDKCTSIAQYARLMQVSHDNIWTAGDNLNDLSMLEAYHGCAMRSGVKEVAMVAEYICDSVADVIEIALKK